MKHSHLRVFTLFLILTTGLTTSNMVDAKGKAHHSYKVVKKSKPAKAKKVITSNTTNDMVGLASFYGYESGPKTASGEPFNPKAMTAAHKRLPFGTIVKVTNMTNHKSVIVKINDCGPFVKNRVIDLSKYAAKAIGLKGVGKVTITIV